MMPRVDWVFFIVALVGVGGGAALWITNGAAHLVWTAATVVAFVPLVVRVSTSLLRREPGVDLIAVLAMAGALLLGEALAGAVIGLMLASGQVLERYATARASRELMSLLARAPCVAHRWQDSVLTTVAVDDVAPGDVLLVKEADVVPVDGVVLEGTASVEFEDVAHSASAGDAIVVPTGVNFVLSNGGNGTLRMMCCFPVGGQVSTDEGDLFTPPWAE